MARIRTVKPELARHRELFDLERETGIPFRFIWAMFPTVCDREGRFKWRPWDLKLDIAPYDNLNFSEVMDRLHAEGMLDRYEFEGEQYGCIPTFHKHQVINNREAPSNLPSPHESSRVEHAWGTREARVGHAPLGEGKGREGKGREHIVAANADDRTGSIIEGIYKRYPRRKGGQNKPAGVKRLKRLSLTDLERFDRAVANYAAYCTAEKKAGTEFVMQFSTFTSRWEEWVDTPQPATRKELTPEEFAREEKARRAAEMANVFALTANPDEDPTNEIA
jgi:hypothetical protein